MFSDLSICYLFLGGTAAGMVAILCCLKLVSMSDRLGLYSASRVSRMSILAFPPELFSCAWPVCFVALLLGILCLMADLGRPERIVAFLYAPVFSTMSVGAYSLSTALACALVLGLEALLDNVRIRPLVVSGVAVLGMLAGIVSLAYTGFLLQDLASVLFWHLPLLPVLFAVSALSCGMAGVLLSAAFVETRQPFIQSF